MNKVILCGRLTREPEIRYNAETQKPSARFNLAVNRVMKSNEADFINCAAFGKTAEVIEKYVKKGSQILVEGNVRTGNYTNKDGQKVYTTEIWVERMEFVGAKASGEKDSKDEVPEGFTKLEEESSDLPF